MKENMTHKDETYKLKEEMTGLKSVTLKPIQKQYWPLI